MYEFRIVTLKMPCSTLSLCPENVSMQDLRTSQYVQVGQLSLIIVPTPDPIKTSLCMKFSSYFLKQLSLLTITLKFFLNSQFHWLSVVGSSTTQCNFSTILSWTCCFLLSSAVLCILHGEAHLVTALYLLQSLSSHSYLCSISCLLLTAFSRALMALWWEPVLSAGLISLIENSLMFG